MEVSRSVHRDVRGYPLVVIGDARVDARVGGVRAADTIPLGGEGGIQEFSGGGGEGYEGGVKRWRRREGV